MTVVRTSEQGPAGLQNVMKVCRVPVLGWRSIATSPYQSVGLRPGGNASTAIRLQRDSSSWRCTNVETCLRIIRFPFSHCSCSYCSYCPSYTYTTATIESGSSCAGSSDSCCRCCLRWRRLRSHTAGRQDEAIGMYHLRRTSTVFYGACLLGRGKESREKATSRSTICFSSFIGATASVWCGL